MKEFFIQPEQYPDKEAEGFVMVLFSIAAILSDTGISINLDNLFIFEGMVHTSFNQRIEMAFQLLMNRDLEFGKGFERNCIFIY